MTPYALVLHTRHQRQLGKAAEKAERDKHAKYRSFEAKFIVQPIAKETLSAWGPEGLKFVEIGTRLITATKNKRSTSELFQAISIATQRGNATSIIGSLPNINIFIRIRRPFVIHPLAGLDQQYTCE